MWQDDENMYMVFSYSKIKTFLWQKISFRFCNCHSHVWADFWQFQTHTNCHVLFQDFCPRKKTFGSSIQNGSTEIFAIIFFERLTKTSH